jgi:hypothetical protein
VFWIIEEARIRIAEDALRFFKPHSMLGPIAPIFSSRPTQSGPSLDII